MSFLVRTRYLALVLVLLWACADENTVPTSGGLGDSGGSAHDVRGDSTSDSHGEIGSEDGQASDLLGDRDLADLLDVGEICRADAECASGLCLFFEAGVEEGICTWFCSDNSTCPEEYDCIYVLNSGVDIAKVCVPEDLCIDHDEDDYGAGPGCLGRDCDDEDPDLNPGEVEVCDGIDNDCDELIDVMAVDVNQTCDTGRPGVCAPGRTWCDSNRGALFCTAEQLPTLETCDGFDNDCDGFTDEDDEGNPIVVACYNGPEGTEGLGECRSGLRTCVDGFFGNCVGQVIPFPEICDGLNNDCDNRVDEGNPEEGVACDTELPGVCATGLTDCSGEGDLTCQPVHTPGELEEVCNHLDDDCDEAIDEDDEGNPVSRVCYYGPEGTLDETDSNRICRSGVETCDDGLYRECVDQVLPGVELCNGLDDDCNGAVDDEPLDIGSSCETGLDGVCFVGIVECHLGTDSPRVCVPKHLPGELVESCNHLDDDCDGEVDKDGEGNPLTQVCYYGPEGTLNPDDPKRICRAGVATCDGGFYRACVDQVLPAPERCNLLDDDCDGEVDNLPIDVGLSCDTGELGVCASGLTVCTDDSEEPLACVPLNEPDDEACNGLDDDCDGTTDKDDEGEPLERDCYYGPEGTLDEDDTKRRCRGGTETCEDGLYRACVGQVLPAVETCNGIDDDCDGEVDNEPIDVGVTCETGFDGVCAVGIIECQTDEDVPRVCVAPHQPYELTESCNRLDDDCDGLTDEGPTGHPLTTECYYGEEGTLDPDDLLRICRSGTATCEEGIYRDCVDQVLPAPEVCNLVDDDCNGVPDDDPYDEGQACITEHPGACAAGITVCTDDLIQPLQCVPLNSPGDITESCNGVDDDCNGSTDRDSEGRALTRPCYYGPEGTLNLLDLDRRCRAGTETCTGGAYGLCDGQLLPIPELCNGVDDNCNGTTDEGDPGAGVACDTGLHGVCAAGVTTCEGGVPGCQQIVASSDEACDGLDNNCNNNVDEGNPGGDAVCATGEPGICMEGRTTCTGGHLVCNRYREPETSESCNYLDDNCNGKVDETFRQDETGPYNTVAHCAGCNINCAGLWIPGPATYHVEPTCPVASGVASCDFDCVEGWVDADRIPDNGCELNIIPTDIYVSTNANGGDDDATDCGSWVEADEDWTLVPCESITRGVERASVGGRVLVSDGVFRENITLVDGISVLGGHSSVTWKRNPAINVTVIQGYDESPSSQDRVAVDASGITVRATEFSGFTIWAEAAEHGSADNGGYGGNSIAIYVKDSNQNLEIVDNVVYGGTGGNGIPGQPGENGLNGNDGDGGHQGVRSSDVCVDEVYTGGSAGSRSCTNWAGGDPTDVSGGAGGDSNVPVSGTENGGGGDGLPPSEGGEGQAGGVSFSGVDGVSCLVSGDINAHPGESGVSGGDSDGADTQPSNGGLVEPTSDTWRGLVGENGDHAASHGSGGGGGGAAAGVDISGSSYCYFGASGGAGGSGGCGGQGGFGGLAGGGSFGVLIVFEALNPTSSSQMPNIHGNAVQRGIGGQGGPGGAGGAGGYMGFGGMGGIPLAGSGDFCISSCSTEGEVCRNYVCEYEYEFCSLQGAPGGSGGRGGHAGGGGGGPGGVSWDIYVYNVNDVDPGYLGANSFGFSDSETTGGAGGRGGTSSNVPDGVGVVGPVGEYGNIKLFN